MSSQHTHTLSVCIPSHNLFFFSPHTLQKTQKQEDPPTDEAEEAAAAEEAEEDPWQTVIYHPTMVPLSN